MASAVFDPVIGNFGTGLINWTTASKIYTALSSTATAPTKTQGTYGTVFGSLTQVANGSGYTTGGVAITPGTVTLQSAVQYFDAPDAAWTSASFTSYYAVNQYCLTASTPAVSGNYSVSYHDLTGPVQVISGTLTLTWSNSPYGAIFTITVAAAS